MNAELDLITIGRVSVDLYGQQLGSRLEDVATFAKAVGGCPALTPEQDWPAAFTFTIAPEYLAAFRKSRTAMLVGDLTAQKYAWRVGDRIPLKLPVAQQKRFRRLGIRCRRHIRRQ